MLSGSRIKKIFEYSVLISAAYYAFCASGCVYSGDSWKFYRPIPPEESRLPFMTERIELTDES